MPRKRHLESRALKSDEKVANLDPQNLNYFNMAAEGLLKSLIPPTSQKSPKSRKMAPIWAPKGTLGAQRALKETPKQHLKKQRAKTPQKTLKKNLS